MQCANCGQPLPPDSRFCIHCGAPANTPAAAAPDPGAGPSYAAGPPYTAGPPYATGPMPPPPGSMRALSYSRVGRNLQTSGVLWCCYGVYRLVAGLIGVIFFRAFVLRDGWGSGWPFGAHTFSSVPPWLGSLVPVILIGTAISSAFAIFAGIGLLKRQSWGRVVAIIAAVLALIKFPFGTALGIYTLWVLAPRASGEEYADLTDRGV